MRASRKYWFTAVSSAVRTSLRSSVISSLPCIATSGQLMTRTVASRDGAVDGCCVGVVLVEQALQLGPATPAAATRSTSLGDLLDAVGPARDAGIDGAIRDGSAGADEHRSSC